ncbi:quinolinate synthase NadA [Acidipila sp. EB88]|uniref:quinolinate synthase NadA n=1 Tax=Acidipila sp. EB88 TaxID=2305226 RepID=UPI000F5F45C9|nr:quinolinate synthase NadA [Acidipila sp. EB88]RRA50104.1 quinolinate synthase NadA [Acidipila sp. EB88]
MSALIEDVPEVLDLAPVQNTSAEACSLDNYLVLPDHSMDDRIAAARRKLGSTAILLGHHYQRDEVIRFADYTGDSYKLSKIAAETAAKYLVFCGVHFMAESADVLGRPDQQVILPDINAGCSMADMAEIGQVEDCWDALLASGLTASSAADASLAAGSAPAGAVIPGSILPLTYMNSTAAIKAFCGERGGLVCTSSNARSAFEWAFQRAEKILFLPDQHLGRNTAHAMGIPLSDMVVYDPYQINGGLTPARLKAAKVILWKGHCSVHQRFLPDHVDQVRAKYPGIQVVVHPECRWEVCQKADALGSTERIIQLVEQAPVGSTFAIGTEIHLVNRLARRFAEQGKKIITLDDTGCLCTTMFRISPQHLCWVLENLIEGRVVNQISVRDDVKHWAKVALDRMLDVKV